MYNVCCTDLAIGDYYCTRACQASVVSTSEVPQSPASHPATCWIVFWRGNERFWREDGNFGAPETGVVQWTQSFTSNSCSCAARINSCTWARSAFCIPWRWCTKWVVSLKYLLRIYMFRAIYGFAHSIDCASPWIARNIYISSNMAFYCLGFFI